MKRGRCPKCSSSNVRMQPKSGREAIMIGWRTVSLNLYICASCGYAERFVADSAKLRIIEQKWPLAVQ